MIHVTPIQLGWLNSRGGRGLEHVNADKRGLYVNMYKPKDKIQRVYLPNDSDIISMRLITVYNDGKHGHVGE
jgi:hypothetical protein